MKPEVQAFHPCTKTKISFYNTLLEALFVDCTFPKTTLFIVLWIHVVAGEGDMEKLVYSVASSNKSCEEPK